MNAVPVKRSDGRVVLSFEGEVSKTKQEFRKETDINLIVARHKMSGEWSHVSSAVAVYGDASSIPDFMGAMETVLRGKALFASLPADVRGRFDNDPGVFLARAQDPAFKDKFTAIWAEIFPKQYAKDVAARKDAALKAAKAAEVLVPPVEGKVVVDPKAGKP